MDRGIRHRLLGGPAPIVLLALAASAWAAVRGGFKDLSVYQYGGDAVLRGLPLSSDPVTGLPFTYPPFAAVLMAPLGPLPHRVAAALWIAGSVVALAFVVRLVLRQSGMPLPGWALAALTAACLGLEPVWQNLTFGQINAFVMAVVLIDLLRPERRWSGVPIGLAAAVKLTPLVFVALLFLVGRRASAARAAAVFLGSVVVGAVLVEGSSAYWTDRLTDASRVGPPALAHNQSAYGALTRILDGEPPTWLWLAVAGPIATSVLFVAANRWRRGDRPLGACLAAIAMLVASPVSWSHHWVWALPIVLVLAGRNRWAAVAWAAVFVTRPILWPPWADGREYGWSPAEHLAGNGYLVAALVLSAWAAVSPKRSDRA